MEFCVKIVVTNGLVGTISISGLDDLSVYRMYYTTANDYPLSTVLSDTVEFMDISIFSLFGNILSFNVMASILLVVLWNLW